MGQKVQLGFTKIYTEILLLILGYSFCTEHHIFGTFLPNAGAFYIIKYFSQPT
jgi:hypothetical protein